MSQATHPLRDYAPFLDALAAMDNAALGILAGALFTALVQSSAATTGIAIAFAGQGLISLEAGIAIAFGANIGTCATAMLAAIGQPPAAKQAAWAHLLFNVLGVAVWIAFLPQLAALVRWLSPDSTSTHTAASYGSSRRFIETRATISCSPGATGILASNSSWTRPATFLKNRSAPRSVVDSDRV